MGNSNNFSNSRMMINPQWKSSSNLPKTKMINRQIKSSNKGNKRTNKRNKRKRINASFV